MQKDYPTLSLIARDYLSIQATSVASEQDDKSARAILCLKSWIQKEICIM